MELMCKMRAGPDDIDQGRFNSNKLCGVHGVQLVSGQDMKHERNHHLLPYSTCRAGAGPDQPRLIVQKFWHQRPACLRPIHCTHTTGDQNFAETIANVLTSLPFIAIGIQAPRKNVKCRIYANSLVGVGVASTLYHASRGRLRKYLRWADYTAIATATLCLSRAVRKENPKLLMSASVLFMPIQPLMVSALHTGLMEVSFAKRAFEEPELRKAHTVHKISSLLGGALFVADDLLPKIPFLHAAWHLAAALGLSTCNKLLLLQEQD